MTDADRHRITPYPLRLDADLKSKLQSSAKASDRSLNAEISMRLKKSYAGEVELSDFIKMIESLDSKLELLSKQVEGIRKT